MNLSSKTSNVSEMKTYENDIQHHDWWINSIWKSKLTSDEVTNNLQKGADMWTSLSSNVSLCVYNCWISNLYNVKNQQVKRWQLQKKIKIRIERGYYIML